MKLQLSISLLVSDRIQTVEKCLESLTPILRAIPSELIVVYTGLQTKCLNVVKKYTDHILPFTWCDDFSAARNCGLEKASGEWFLYLDDDEWFEDCSEIITFFQSGEYHNYNSAFYLQRNYGDLKGSSYTDSGVTRLVKLTPETRFVGSIHEHLNLVTVPEKAFSVYVHHYGYASDDVVGQKARFHRNVTLLEADIRKEPNCIRNYIQLAQEYLSEGFYKESEQFCRKALTLNSRDWESFCIDWAQVFLVVSLLLQKKEKEALETGERILIGKQIGQVASLYLFTYLLPLCANQEKYEKGIAFADDFLSIMCEIKAKPELWQKEQILTINRDSIMERSNFLYRDAVICATQVQNYEKIIIYLQCFPWNSGNMKADDYKFLENWKDRFESQKRELLYCLTRVDTKDLYITFQKALLAVKNLDIEEALRFYRLCLSTENPMMRDQILLMALNNGFPLPDFLRNFDLAAWRSYLSGIVNQITIQNYVEYIKKTHVIFAKYPVYQAVFAQKVLPRFLLDPKTADAEFNRILHHYCETVLGLNHTLYKDELFEAPMRFCLPIECRTVLALTEAMDLLDQGDFERAIFCLRDILHHYPSMAAIVKRLLSQINPQKQTITSSETQEFQQLGNQIKAVLRKLMEAGQYHEAFPVAEQLCKLLPEDPEVLKWRQTLRLME